MKRIFLCKLLVLMAFLAVVDGVAPLMSDAADLRGQWVGNAEGSIFGAKGSVNITYHQGEDIYGVVEGGNFFGTARFSIMAKLRGSHIFGSKQGHTFEGHLYPDGTIRGMFRSSDGDEYRVFLQRQSPYWGAPPYSWQPMMPQ